MGDHVALSAGALAHLLALRADLDGIGDELRRFFLLQTRHFFQLDGNLRRTGRSGAARSCLHWGPSFSPRPRVGSLLSPSERCCCKSRSSSRRDRDGPGGGSHAARHRSNLRRPGRDRRTPESHGWPGQHPSGEGRAGSSGSGPGQGGHQDSPTMRRSASGSLLNSFRKSSFRCLYVGLSIWGKFRR